MSELLKAAIADAKAVRATALANARAALEEAFTPKLQSMLSAKLQQEINDEESEEVPAAPEAPLAPAPEEPAGEPQPVDPAVSIDSAPIQLPPEEAAPEGDSFLDEEESLEEYQPLGAGNPDSVHQNDLYEDEDVSLKGAPSGHKTDDPQGKGVCTTFKKDSTNLTAGEPKEKTAGKTTVDREVASFTKDPQGASKELHCGPSKSEDSTSPLKEELDDEIDEQSLDEILKELENEVRLVASDELSEPKISNTPAAIPAAAPVAACEVADQEIDLAELFESDDEEKEEKEEEKENISLKAELQEYRSTVQYLRDRINEVNLLNAKLLYTNKLFKSKVMTNEQKLSVIEAFDLTKSVREAKLIYATLSESFNFGVKTDKKPSSTKVTSVKSITEGLASKSVASTKPTQPAVLTEGAVMANRFKKLAGISK